MTEVVKPKPSQNGTVILVTGVVAALALIAYLSVAFASTSHVRSTSAARAGHRARPFGPWEPFNARFRHLRGAAGRTPVQVVPLSLGTYGARVPTIVLNPVRGHRFLVGLSLEGSGPPVGIEVVEFGPHSPDRYVGSRLVRVTSRWHHFTVAGRVTRGSWSGLQLVVYRSGEIPLGSWFAVRDLTVTVRS
jgi:hypothetical protein